MSIIQTLTEKPGSIASELGATTAQMTELERQGKVVRVGKRSTGKRGRPPVEWAVAGTVVPDAVQDSVMVPEAMWKLIKRRMTNERCKCGLRRDMSHRELRALGAGCTSGRWVCGALDSFRRVVGA